MTIVDKIGRFLASTAHHKIGLTNKYQRLFAESSLYRYFLGVDGYGFKQEQSLLNDPRRQIIILTVFINQMWEFDIINREQHDIYLSMNESADIETRTLVLGILETLYPQILKIWTKKYGKITWQKRN